MRVSIKIFMATQSHTLHSLCILFGSIAMFYLCVWVIERFDVTMTNVLALGVMSATSWLLLFFFTVGAVVTERILRYWREHIRYFAKYQRMLIRQQLVKDLEESIHTRDDK